MSAKDLLFHHEARAKLYAALRTPSDVVKVTLGPKGRTVVLEKPYGAPTIINSGVIVAREIELPDKFENPAAQLVRQVATRTSEMAGDGTTTATVLVQGIGAGGGVVLLRVRTALDTVKTLNVAQQFGVKILCRASDGPLRQIASNAPGGVPWAGRKNT